MSNTNIQNKHHCVMPKQSPYLKAGNAIDYCLEYDDEMILCAGNDEYESQVNFCPICGYEAKVKISVKS